MGSTAGSSPALCRSGTNGATIVQWFGTNTDVTDQKLAEEQVARQAQELRVLNERLTEVDRLKSNSSPTSATSSARH